MSRDHFRKRRAFKGGGKKPLRIMGLYNAKNNTTEYCGNSNNDICT